jgi:hypothetical protein
LSVIRTLRSTAVLTAACHSTQMLNFSVVETIHILKRRRAHFEQVVAGLATLDDIELIICKQLVDLLTGRRDDADFSEAGAEAAPLRLGSGTEATGAALVIKQLDAALAQLRDCMFDGIGDTQQISNELRDAKARRAISDMDPRLFPVPLLSQLQPQREVPVASNTSDIDVAVSEDNRLIQFRLHEKLCRRPDLPLTDATSSISFCIPGWPNATALSCTSLSPSLLPAFLQAIESSQPCVYGPRRRESSTWRQKHKR